jgi:mannose-1-phosphate guanylyltransferase/mannose-6-phosphate isomerase
MFIPVILSGGSGTRLWPLSRQTHPKPFMKLPDGETLIEKTYKRAAKLDKVDEVLTVTNRDYFFLCKDEIEKVKGKFRNSFILEPVKRNTAPAVVMTAVMVNHYYGADTEMLFLAADHLIEDEVAFASVVAEARKSAREGKLVTFGINPTSPETGFGYIEYDPASSKDGSASIVKRFVEKPSLEVAQEYLDSKRYLWNSGMFCFTAKVILDAFRQHSPEVLDMAEQCWGAMLANTDKDDSDDNDKMPEMIEIDKDAFSQFPDISIDYAIMEKASEVMVVPADIGWNDIGSWQAFGELVPMDDKGNRVMGEGILVDVKDTYIIAQNRLVAALGLDNLVIVDTPDALLVANRDRVQDVKEIVKQLKDSDNDLCSTHRTVVRPWGAYTVLEVGNRFQIKKIMVKPTALLSLQMHHHRSEHWVVVSGTAKVTVGEKIIFLHENESVYIPKTTVHRLENPGKVPLEIIEVQNGEYVGEDDIVRMEDIYNRDK